MEPHADKEWDMYPHVILTGPKWDPTVLNNKISDKEGWYNSIKGLNDGFIQTPFDEFSNYRHLQPINNFKILPEVEPNSEEEEPQGTPELQDCYMMASDLNIQYKCLELQVKLNNLDEDEVKAETTKKPREIKKKLFDYNTYWPYYLHAPRRKIQKTFESTTMQFAMNVMSGTHITQTIKLPYPAHNIWRRNKPVATDMIYAQTPAIDMGGQTMVQIYVRCKSLVIDVYGMSTEKEFINTLMDNIKQ